MSPDFETMAGSYNPLLICFSLFVATLAAYTVLEIAERIAAQETRRYRRLWLSGGAMVFASASGPPI